jgi:hypothetical protein
VHVHSLYYKITGVSRKEQSDNTKRILKHFYYGPRKLNIILTQLCNSYSFLNYYLSKVNIVNDAACSCGAPREDAYHYFFTCPNYTEIRLAMMKNLNLVQTIDLNLLTCGVWWFMMILFVKLTKGIGHKFCHLMKSSPINTIN